MNIKLTGRARKDLKKLTKPKAALVVKKIQALASSGLHGKKLKGELKNRYSLRAWPYRIIYSVTNKTIIIEIIQHRQRVYK